MLRLPRLFLLPILLLLAACNSDPWPAEEGFDQEGSDKKAIELANQMMEKQGGYERWQDVRYLAWTYYGHYHIWDKKLNLYRQEKGNRVILMSLVKPEGKIFNDGKRITDPDMTEQALGQAFVMWRFSADMLTLPFRLKAKGVTLRYGGKGVTMAHDTAEIVDAYYHGTGPSGDNRNQIWISPKTHLMTQWAFYGRPDDPQPAFVRDWLGYRDYNGLMLSTQRNSMIDSLSVSHIAVLDTLPRDLFFSARPVDKNQVLAWAKRKK